MPSGAVEVAVLAGAVGFGSGADGVQGGVEGAEPGEPQFFPVVPGCPGCLGGVCVAEQPQAPVGHGPDVGVTGRAEGGECLVPGRSLAGLGVRGLGPDRVIGVVVAVHFLVGADRGGLVLPAVPGGRAGGHRTRAVIAQVGGCWARWWSRRRVRSSIRAVIWIR